MVHARTTKGEPVRRALARMHRRKGRRQAQAQGLTGALRRRLLDAAGDLLIDARNRALLGRRLRHAAQAGRARRRASVGYRDGFGRRGDAAGAPLQGRRRGPGRDGLRRARLMALVHQWLARSGVSQGRVVPLALARGRRRGARRVPCRTHLQAHGARRRPAEAVVERISGHSTRVGAAQDMVAEGIGMAAILHAGRWKTTAMVNRYGERLLARRSGAAQLARIQHRE